MFYNTENYFDTVDDTLVNDDEYLPGSDKKWSYNRFREKTMNLYKTIVAVGEIKPPEIVCFAEVENRYVLKELTNHTPLEKYPYDIVHFDSPDQRGIDVGLIFRKDIIQLLQSKPIRITFSGESLKKTRDILFFKACINSIDTLYVLVNHWPSRRGGEKKSEYYRVQVANALRSTIDSILLTDPCAKIVITGDFNDEPINQSIKESLKTQKVGRYVTCNELYNLSENLLENCSCGTYRYRTSWSMFDQFIVSGALLDEKHKIYTGKDCLHIAEFDFLLIKDEKYGGRMPFRTYVGPVYKGGFSDHLPIYLDLYY
jgi:exonuclease III